MTGEVPDLAAIAVRVRERRVQYEAAGLDRGDLLDDPAAQWALWYSQAESAGVAEPNAMTLATCGPDGTPDARLVLARGVDGDGITFYSNERSAKAEQLASCPAAAVVFGWVDLQRQVRARGPVVRVSDAESDAYFASRPRAAQLGAWASPQSQPIASRDVLQAELAVLGERFAHGDVPRPPHWGGWRVVPVSWEFWQGRPSRLHDRFRYAATADGRWVIERLGP